MSHVRDLHSKYEAILERASRGHVSNQEIAEVAAELQQQSSDLLRYTLLLTLGRARAVTYRDLVEPFLEYREWPMLAGLALSVLCDYFDLTSQYRSELLQFMRGVEWDDEEHVWIKAVSTAGEYLRSHADPALLRELLRNFENQDARKFMRQWAYSALARAMGRDYKEIPGVRDFDLVTEIDPNVIQEAKQRLSREIGQVA